MKTCLLIALAAAFAFAQAPPSELYYLVFLRPDPARKDRPKEELEKIQSAHMANIQAMAASGVMVAAGPFDTGVPRISGLFVFKTGSLEEARRIAEQDPTVREHRNTVDVYAWHGPKDLGADYRRLHKENPATPEDMGMHPFWMLYRGPAWQAQSPLLRAHDAYLEELRGKGKLSTAGAIDANDAGLQGAAVFRRIPEAEARELIANDPAVKGGVLRAEYQGWWSAAHVLP
jgi:uncharacterized protein YciI